MTSHELSLLYDMTQISQGMQLQILIQIGTAFLKVKLLTIFNFAKSKNVNVKKSVIMTTIFVDFRFITTFHFDR